MIRWRSLPMQRRAGLVNLAIAAVVAVSLWFSIWLWRDRPQPSPPSSRLSDVTVTWQCTGGHRYEAAGACGIGKCQVCDAQAYLFRRYRCPEHGEFDAMFWREAGADDRSTIAGIRFGDEPWQRSPSAIRCPTCGQAMSPVPFVPPDLYPAQGKQEGG